MFMHPLLTRVHEMHGNRHRSGRSEVFADIMGFPKTPCQAKDQRPRLRTGAFSFG